MGRFKCHLPLSKTIAAQKSSSCILVKLESSAALDHLSFISIFKAWICQFSRILLLTSYVRQAYNTDKQHTNIHKTLNQNKGKGLYRNTC